VEKGEEDKGVNDENATRSKLLMKGTEWVTLRVEWSPDGQRSKTKSKRD
jgi:hypothetical protein